MEIQCEKFNKWTGVVNTVEKLIPNDLFAYGDIYAYIIEEPYEFEPDVQEKIIKAADDILTAANELDMLPEIRDEIDFNIANIQSDELVKRYLNFILKKSISNVEVLESYFDYERISKIEHRLKHHDVIHYGIRDYRAFTKEILSRKSEENYQMTDEELDTYNQLKKNKDIIKYDAFGFLLHSFIETLNCYRQVTDYILDRLDTLNERPPAPLDHELTFNTHRLLLLHKLGIFEPLKDQYYQHLGAVKFTKLLATILGIPSEKSEGLRPSVTALNNELVKPNKEKTFQTIDAVNKVNAYLAELGITI